MHIQPTPPCIQPHTYLHTGTLKHTHVCTYSSFTQQQLTHVTHPFTYTYNHTQCITTHSQVYTLHLQIRAPHHTHVQLIHTHKRFQTCAHHICHPHGLIYAQTHMYSCLDSHTLTHLPHTVNSLQEMRLPPHPHTLASLPQPQTGCPTSLHSSLPHTFPKLRSGFSPAAHLLRASILEGQA